MTRAQREYFLREQLKQIQSELGDADSKQAEIQELREKINDAKLPPPAQKEAEKQINRLEKIT